ncbi:ribosomal protein, putative [Ichthyophthirius multifiliis]|uniref:Ribosomal protein, putative n=1 Tax=Ichthyophthirius multifiliis TaxID=5932 RepID=G0QVR8_ICHMU|nr:ribosomal protein, putative [Ichthyophthirius multifiliis]EGR30685.1 ribosomal protein, putative [Ichthyophthirius multifiliis]|eukprot:XP_004032272.1 ribosomal protein, putative [Ichthyophthirius multifiliis]
MEEQMKKLKYRRNSKRLGRGPGSGKGKTSARGMNGHGHRSNGGVHIRFEGGQTPWFRRVPKFGMKKLNLEKPKAINIKNLMYFIQKGRIDATKPITMKVMFDAGLFHSAKYGIKIVGRGLNFIDRPLNLEVSDASESVIKAIKEKGGSVKCIYMTCLQLRELFFPEKFPINLRKTVPPKRVVKKMENIRKRGADVEYNVPRWQQDILKQQQEDKDVEEKEQFVLPVPRFPGSGKNKIRTRKPIITKQINYKF